MPDFNDNTCGVGWSENVLRWIGFQGKFSRMCYAHDKAQEDKLKKTQFEKKSWEEIDDEADRNAYRLAVTEYSKQLPARYVLGTAYNLLLVGAAHIAERGWTAFKRRVG